MFVPTPVTGKAPTIPAFRADVIERIGEPMDVRGVVVLLASPAASLITVLIDGGSTGS